MNPSSSKENIHVVRKPMVIEMKNFNNNKDIIEVAYDWVKCPICLCVVADAVETECCGLLLCEECVEPIKYRPCPQCRRGYRTLYKANRTVRRILDDRRNEETVEPVPDQQPKIYHCPCENCEFSGPRDSYVTHCQQLHVDAVHVDHVIEPDDPGRVLNELGRTARVGRSGKYYCGVWKHCTCCDLLGCRCSCCRKRCGPDDGCNCGACMNLDIVSRGLGLGYLVNQDGVICKYTYTDPRSNRLQQHWNCLPNNCQFTQKLALIDGLKQMHTFLVPCKSCVALQKQFELGRYSRFIHRR